MRKGLLALLLLLGVAIGLAPAWWVKGHESITEAATARLPDEMPAFFRAGGKALAHFAGDPDRWKNRETPFLKIAEEPNHFLDTEDLNGKPLPTDRFQAIELIRKLDKEPGKVGLLPYAILEGFDRLTCAFADYRRDPANPAIPMKCLVYAGNMAHYTTDCAMPLHTTRDYDGRKNKDGTVEYKGIHARLDGFPEKFRLTPEEICRGLEAKAIEDPWTYVKQFIDESHTHVDRCYEFEAQNAFATPTEQSRAFVLERCRAGAQFTMDLWYTAWLKSAKLPPPY